MCSGYVYSCYGDMNVLANGNVIMVIVNMIV